MPLRFLHISDIHFKRQRAGTDHWDLDENIRNEVELDLGRFHKENGIVNAILVGADVAFSGASTEYIIADEWLAKNQFPRRLRSRRHLNNSRYP